MHKKDITKRVKNYYRNYCSFLITKRGKILLQNAATFLLQNASILLQNAAGITKRVDFVTKCGRYYKTRHLLQNGA